MSVGAILKKNIYAHDVLSKAKNLKQNKMFQTIADEVLPIDPIEDFEDFSACISFMKKKYQSWPSPYSVGMESTFYGHLKSLVEYAGLKYEDAYRLLLPNVEHGIAWLQRVPANLQQPFAHSFVSQGAYRKALINSEKPWMPNYVIGPYIHYAKQLYGDSRRSEIKKKLGRTILVFPAHSYEGSSVSYGRRGFVKDILSRYSDEYDSVMISAYWHDADDEVYSLFRKEGAIVVSAGLRNDPLFISRLKTIISLSDAVAGNAIGTNIGYCMYLEKPFSMIGAMDTEIKDYGNSYGSLEEANLLGMTQCISRAFDIHGCQEMQDRFYREYWGGPSALKSPNEIRCILGISRDILRESHGCASKCTTVVQDVYSQALRGTSAEDALRAKLLTDALGFGDMKNA